MQNSLLPRVLAIVALFAGALPADEIRFRDGRKPTADVTVKDETLKQIEYTRQGLNQPQTLDSQLVKEIEYKNPPDDYKAAVKSLADGDFDTAGKLYLAAAADAERRPGLAAKCHYLAAEAFRQGGQDQDAIAAYDALIAKFANSRYLPLAEIGKGIVLMHGTDGKRAEAHFTRLKAEAASKGYGERAALEADLRLLMLGEQANPAGVIEAYKKLATQTEATHPEIANLAKLRMGKALIGAQKFDEAKAYFQGILDQRAASPQEIVAGAYNGLGAAIYYSALAKYPNAADKQQAAALAADLKLALYNFLRVIVSYDQVSEEQPEAMYHAGKCFQHVEGTESQQRSQTLLRRVASEYPNSRWALEAKKG